MDKVYDPRFVSFDGASFDAHRHHTLIEALDHASYDILFTPEAAINMGYDLSEW